MVALGMVVLPPLAGAEEEAPPASRSSAIEEIVVTAERREASLQDTALSVDALGGADLEFRSVESFTDLQYQVPNLSFGELDGSTHVTIRGVGPNVFTGAAEQPVAINIDGVYQPRATTGILGINDVERIEVLRGPQGTLYGRNATAGAINFILKKPTDELEAKLRLGLSRFDGVDFVGVVSGPIVKGLVNARLLGEYDETGGFIENLVFGRKVDDRSGKGGRVAVGVLPFSGMTADFSILYRKDDDVDPPAVLIKAPDPLLEAMIGIVPPTRSNPDDFVEGRFDEVKENRLGVGETETTNGSLAISWDLGFARVQSTTGFQKHSLFQDYENDSTARSIFHVAGRRDSSRSLMELLSASGSFWRIEWLAGGFFFDEDFEIFIPVDNPPALAGAGLRVRTSGDEDIRSLAFFGDATLSITRWLQFFAGLRFTRDDKAMLQSVGLFTGPGVPVPLGACDDNRVRNHFTDSSPRYGVRLKPTDDIMIYAHRQQGFKSGGVNFTGCDDAFEPEEVETTEVGLKSSWFDRRVVANVAFFDSDYRNFQVFTTPAGGIVPVVVNAESATIRGGEIEVQAELLEGLSMDAGVSLLDAAYDEFRDTDTANPSAGRQDLSGRPLNWAPDYTVGLGLEYQRPIPLGPLGMLRLRGEWFRTDDVVFRPFGAKEDEQEGYSIANAFASVATASERYELRLFGKNLGQTRYFVTKAATLIGHRWGTVGAPRVLGLELTARF